VTGWTWVDTAVARAIHDELLARHGGTAGLRDAGAFASAMARPGNLAAYGNPDAASLAAAYGFGLARGHAFVDGNKRLAYVVMEVFLALNGHRLDATDADAVLTFVAMAAGDLDQAQLAAWVRGRIAA
jgi:death on curing protein